MRPAADTQLIQNGIDRTHSQPHLSQRMGPGLETSMSSRYIFVDLIGERVCVCASGNAKRVQRKMIGF